MEVEAKFRLKCDPGLVFKKLVERGFIETGFYLETDVFFKHPCIDFSSTDEALRVRYRRSLHNGLTTCYLCYKGPRLSSGLVKVREEHEVRLEDFDGILKILYKLGFVELVSYTKVRKEMVNGDVKVCLDELLSNGFFLEIEAKEIGEVESLFNELKNCLEPVSKTYLEICLDTGRCVAKFE